MNSNPLDDAWRDGRAAFKNGVPFTHNPHNPKPTSDKVELVQSKAFAWDRGWIEAKQDEGRAESEQFRTYKPSGYLKALYGCKNPRSLDAMISRGATGRFHIGWLEGALMGVTCDPPDEYGTAIILTDSAAVGFIRGPAFLFGLVK